MGFGPVTARRCRASSVDSPLTETASTCSTGPTWRLAASWIVSGSTVSGRGDGQGKTRQKPTMAAAGSHGAPGA